jgi:hypothetical protein
MSQKLEQHREELTQNAPVGKQQRSSWHTPPTTLLQAVPLGLGRHLPRLQRLPCFFFLHLPFLHRWHSPQRGLHLARFGRLGVPIAEPGRRESGYDPEEGAARRTGSEGFGQSIESVSVHCSLQAVWRRCTVGIVPL